MVKAYLGIGSNLSEPKKQVEMALSLLAKLPHSRLLRSSALYQSKPLGLLDQPDFVNAVCVIETRLSPRQLLTALQAIEAARGRIRDKLRFGPRVIDLDILLYGQLQINEPNLQIPHPRMFERDFVLIPLAEVEPDLILPSGASILNLKAHCVDRGMQRIEDE